MNQLGLQAWLAWLRVHTPAKVNKNQKNVFTNVFFLIFYLLIAFCWEFNITFNKFKYLINGLPAYILYIYILYILPHTHIYILLKQDYWFITKAI